MQDEIESPRARLASHQESAQQQATASTTPPPTRNHSVLSVVLRAVQRVVSMNALQRGGRLHRIRFWLIRFRRYGINLLWPGGRRGRPHTAFVHFHIAYTSLSLDLSLSFQQILYTWPVTPIYVACNPIYVAYRRCLSLSSQRKILILLPLSSSSQAAESSAESLELRELYESLAGKHSDSAELAVLVDELGMELQASPHCAIPTLFLTLIHAIFNADSRHF